MPRSRWIVVIAAVTILVAGVLGYGGYRVVRHIAHGPSALNPTASKTPHPTALTSPGPPSPAPASPSASGSFTASGPVRFKNVVLLVADDLDWNLWNEIPRLKALQQQGTTFTNYVVAESLCCPSRTTILRAQYVHNHHVISNDASTGGGWETYRDRGYPHNCLASWLQAGGVNTGLIGKYLNGFPAHRREATQPLAGWNYSALPISRVADYRGYNYRMAVNGKITFHGDAPTDYLNDVLDQYTTDFLHSTQNHFFLELATYAPHLPAPAAPRHMGAHSDAVAPRTPAYNTAVRNAPTWQRGLPALRPGQEVHLDHIWRQRADSAESVADSVDTVQAALRATGHLDDTLLIVTSDNGFHVGSYRLRRGKRTAYDQDTVVPLVMVGPGIARGRTIAQMTSETDLGPTIASALGQRTPTWVDGRSLWPLVESHSAAQVRAIHWRRGVLSESLGTVLPSDPDYQLISAPRMVSVHTRRWLFVRYLSGEEELYDRLRDPYEIHNVIDSTSPAVVAALSRELTALATCSGRSCRYG